MFGMFNAIQLVCSPRALFYALLLATLVTRVTAEKVSQVDRAGQVGRLFRYEGLL